MAHQAQFYLAHEPSFVFATSTILSSLSPALSGPQAQFYLA